MPSTFSSFRRSSDPLAHTIPFRIPFSSLDDLISVAWRPVDLFTVFKAHVLTEKCHSGSPLLAIGLEGIASPRLVSYLPHIASYRLASYRLASLRIASPRFVSPRHASRPLNRAPPPFHDHLTRPDARTGHSRTPNISPYAQE